MIGTIIRVLLAVLNSRFVNRSPCGYGYVNNIDAFSIDNLRSEVRQRPELSVRQLIEEAERFKTCPVRRHGLDVRPEGSAVSGYDAAGGIDREQDEGEARC